MKIFIDVGHNSLSGDTGSPGIKFEDELTKLVGNKVVEFLKKNSDYEVKCPNPQPCRGINESLSNRCKAANEWKADLFVSIHFNAFNKQANGTEVFISREDSKARPVAERVLSKIVTLGFANRGVKVANYYVIKNTSMQAILVECCFCDSDKDMKLFNPDLMAEAIAEGILNKNIPPNTPAIPHSQQCVLTIPTKTFLKPSTASSDTFKNNELVTILPGSFDVDLLADEEGHYLINGGIGKGFIYAKHCEIKAKT